jgi:hypothetical protein
MKNIFVQGQQNNMRRSDCNAGNRRSAPLSKFMCNLHKIFLTGLPKVHLLRNSKDRMAAIIPLTLAGPAYQSSLPNDVPRLISERSYQLSKYRQLLFGLANSFGTR